MVRPSEQPANGSPVVRPSEPVANLQPNFQLFFSASFSDPDPPKLVLATLQVEEEKEIDQMTLKITYLHKVNNICQLINFPN